MDQSVGLDSTNNVRRSKVDLLSTRDLDFHQRQIKNAAPAVDDYDYVVLKQIKDLINAVTSDAQGTNQPVLTVAGGGSFAVPPSDTFVIYNRKGVAGADPNFAWNYDQQRMDIVGQAGQYALHVQKGFVACDEGFNTTSTSEAAVNVPNGTVLGAYLTTKNAVEFVGITQPPIDPDGKGDAVLIYDKDANQLMVSYDTAPYVPLGGGGRAAGNIKGEIQFTDGKGNFLADPVLTWDVTSGVLANQSTLPNAGVIAPIFNATADADGYAFQIYIASNDPRQKYVTMMDKFGNISTLGFVAENYNLLLSNTVAPPTSALGAVLYYDHTSKQLLVSYEGGTYGPFGGGISVGPKYSVQLSDGAQKFLGNDNFFFDQTSNLLTVKPNLTNPTNSGIISPTYSATGSPTGIAFQAVTNPSNSVVIDMSGNISATGAIASKVDRFAGQNVPPPLYTGSYAQIYYDGPSQQFKVSYDGQPWSTLGTKAPGNIYNIIYHGADGNLAASGNFQYNDQTSILNIGAINNQSGVIAQLFNSSATGNNSAFICGSGSGTSYGILGNGYGVFSNLKINGIAYSWPSTLPTVGQALTASDGSGTLTWSTISGGKAPGADQNMVFNDNGNFGASPNFIYDKTGNILTIGATSTTAGIIAPVFNSSATGNNPAFLCGSGTGSSYGILGNGIASLNALKLVTPLDTQVAYMKGTQLSGSQYLLFVPPVPGVSTGYLRISADATAQTFFQINAPVVTGRRVDYMTNNLLRWSLRTGGDAETGSNAGSTFDIMRYDDSGNYLSSPIIINRQTGQVTISNLNATITAPGANTQVIFNKAGVFGASPYFAYSEGGGLWIQYSGTNIYHAIGADASGASSPNTYACMWYDTTNLVMRISVLSGGVSWRNVILCYPGGWVGIGKLSATSMLDVAGTTTSIMFNGFTPNTDTDVVIKQYQGTFNIYGSGKIICQSVNTSQSTVIPAGLLRGNQIQVNDTVVSGQWIFDSQNNIMRVYWAANTTAIFITVNAASGVVTCPYGLVTNGDLRVGESTTNHAIYQRLNSSYKFFFMNAQGTTIYDIQTEGSGITTFYYPVVFNAGFSIVHLQCNWITCTQVGSQWAGIEFFNTSGNHWTVYNSNDALCFYNNVTGINTFTLTNGGVLTVAGSGVIANLFNASNVAESSAAVFSCGQSGRFGISANGAATFSYLTIYEPASNQVFRISHSSNVTSFINYGNTTIATMTHTTGEWKFFYYITTPTLYLYGSSGHGNESITIDSSDSFLFRNYQGTTIVLFNMIGGSSIFYYPVQFNSTVTFSGAASFTQALQAPAGVIAPIFNAGSNTGGSQAFQCGGAQILGNGAASFGATNTTTLTASGTIYAQNYLVVTGDATASGNLIATNGYVQAGSRFVSFGKSGYGDTGVTKTILTQQGDTLRIVGGILVANF